MNLLKKKGILCILIAAFFSVIGMKVYFDRLIGPVDTVGSQSIMVQIPKGVSTHEIAEILKKHNIIQSDIAFRVLSKLEKKDGKMKAGTYEFKTNMNNEEIMNTLIQGKVFKDTVKFTIPEGFEFHQIVDRLAKMKLIDQDKFQKIAEEKDFDYAFLKDIPKGKNRLEGFLFPDTYEVSKDASEEEIIDKMLQRFDQVFKKDYYDKMKNLNMNMNKVITLASIIEREAKLDDERKMVSSVFHNRIRKGMFLQSCATVQYILGERKARLTLKDIEIHSPYNTYQNAGLPPKPIASPGAKSIEAALYPKDTDYLYFVVSKNGAHHFSKTYKEHLQAKNSKN